MAKPYIIELSPKNITRTKSTDTCPACGHKEITGEEPLCLLEKSVLIQLFEIAATLKKKISEHNLCCDCIDDVNNLKEGVLIIEFTLPDIKFLEEGFGAISGFNQFGSPKRPMTWLKCRNLFEQISKPKSKEDWEKEKEEKKKKAEEK